MRKLTAFFYQQQVQFKRFLLSDLLLFLKLADCFNRLPRVSPTPLLPSEPLQDLVFVGILTKVAYLVIAALLS